MLKLFIQDNGWEGALIVIAESESEARKIMEKQNSLMFRYDPESSVNEYEIINGLNLSTSGDF